MAVMPSFAFAVLSPASWLWLKPLSVNLPMSLTSATVVPAVGLALLDPAVPSAAATTQIVTTARTAAQRGILKMYPSCYRKSRPVSVPCATDDDPSLLLGPVSRERRSRAQGHRPR